MTAAPLNIAETSDNSESGSRRASTREHDAAVDTVRSRRRGAELEDAIRTACVAELADSGYGLLTIESVASRAQTGKASIYRRWPSKQHLVMDSVGCLMSGPLLRLSATPSDASTTTRDALLELMMHFSELMAGPQGDAMRSVMSESLRDAAFSSSFECDFYDPRKQALIELLERGVERGEVRPDAVGDTVVEMIAGTFIHRVLIRRNQPTKADIEEMLDRFVMPAIRP